MFDSSPELFAVFHALPSLLTPRHPPCALSSLTTFIERSFETRNNILSATFSTIIAGKRADTTVEVTFFILYNLDQAEPGGPKAVRPNVEKNVC